MIELDHIDILHHLKLEKLKKQGSKHSYAKLH